MTLFVSYFKGQVNSTHVTSDLRNLTVEVKSNIKYTFAVSIKQIPNDIIIIRTDEFRIKKTKTKNTMIMKIFLGKYFLRIIIIVVA